MVDEPGQPLILEAADPITDRLRTIAEKASGLGTAHALGHQQNAVQTVVVSRFVIPPYFILEAEHNGFRISNGKRSHPQNIAYYARLLMTLCIIRDRQTAHPIAFLVNNRARAQLMCAPRRLPSDARSRARRKTARPRQRQRQQEQAHRPGLLIEWRSPTATANGKEDGLKREGINKPT